MAIQLFEGVAEGWLGLCVDVPAGLKTAPGPESSCETSCQSGFPIGIDQNEHKQNNTLIVSALTQFDALRDATSESTGPASGKSLHIGMPYSRAEG